MSTTVQVPEALKADTIEAQVVKKQIWDRMWRDNEHFMAAIVGREGSGKSMTGLKLAEVTDPSFSAERVMFEPKPFLERLKEWKDNGETQGKVVVADEAGVGVGVRTWHDKDQILFNQVLQVIRDENMTMFFTIPRLSELDSQTRGRLHALLEMGEKKDGEWAKVKWLNWRPTRDERSKIYRNHMEIQVRGQKRTVKRLSISPPSEQLVSEYKDRKEVFQNDLYEKAISQMEDDVDDEKSVKDVAVEIADEKVEDYVSVHNQNKTPYINTNLIRADYEVSQRDAAAVKDLLERRFNTEELEQYA